MEYKIREDSFIAKIAAWKLKSQGAAIVIGKTIHLHNIRRAQFLANKRLLNHELCHVRQYREHGFLGFIFKYLIESVRHGYYKNKFEQEARAAELLS